MSAPGQRYSWPPEKIVKMATSGRVSHPSTAKRPRLEKRKFLPSWKMDFPWVIYDTARGMRCTYCMDAGKKNAFTSGCDKLKKDALSKHACNHC